MTTREQRLQINDLEILFTSDVHGGEILDTKVEINGRKLFQIAGENIEKFSDELKTLIQKFRI
jgi:hypothetical protein